MNSFIRSSTNIINPYYDKLVVLIVCVCGCWYDCHYGRDFDYAGVGCQYLWQWLEMEHWLWFRVFVAVIGGCFWLSADGCQLLSFWSLWWWLYLWLVAGGYPLVAGGCWLVAGGYLLVAGGCWLVAGNHNCNCDCSCTYNCNSNCDCGLWLLCLLLTVVMIIIMIIDITSKVLPSNIQRVKTTVYLTLLGVSL